MERNLFLFFRETIFMYNATAEIINNPNTEATSHPGLLPFNPHRNALS